MTLAVRCTAARTPDTAADETRSPGPGEVEPAPAHVGIRGTDPHIFHGDKDARVRMPAVLGHEMSGRVVSAGPGAEGWARRCRRRRPGPDRTTPVHTTRRRRRSADALADIASRLPAAKVLATTPRAVPSAGVNDWTSAAWSRETGFVDGPRMPGPHVPDRIGSGDAFAAGLIHGLLTGTSRERALTHGTAHGALVMTAPGDVSMVTLAGVEALMAGGSAHVRR